MFVVDCLVVYAAWALYLNTQDSGFLQALRRIDGLPFGTGPAHARRLLLVSSAVSSMWIPFLFAVLPSSILPRSGRARSTSIGRRSPSEESRHRFFDSLRSWVDRHPTALEMANGVRTFPISFVQARFWLLALFVDSNAAALYAIPLSIALGLTIVADWIGLTTPQNFSGYTAFSAWFAATTVWAIPFGRGLLFIDESCARAYATLLHRELQRLTGHTLILGYSPIAQRFLDELTANELLHYSTRLDHQRASAISCWQTAVSASC